MEQQNDGNRSNRTNAHLPQGEQNICKTEALKEEYPKVMNYYYRYSILEEPNVAIVTHIKLLVGFVAVVR